MVEIIWHGHACFELRGNTTTVVLDPFVGLGIPDPKAEADIVLCTHGHRDHSNIAPVLKNTGTALVGFVGSYFFPQGVRIQGIKTSHDRVEGGRRGANTVYVVQLDGFAFCHLGDLGHDLTAEQIQRIGDLDVLFTPAGGGPQTMRFDVASSIVERLKPKIVFPMHYDVFPGESELLSRFGRIDDFLKGKKNVKKIDGQSFNLVPENLPKETTIMVLSFKGHAKSDIE